MAESPALELMIELGDPQLRTQACQRLARLLGVDDILVLVNDPVLGNPIPALGMPQTIRGGRAWRRFLHRCSSDGDFQGQVDVLSNAPRPVLAHCVAGACLVMIGGEPDASALPTVCRLMHLLAAVLCAEQRHVMASSEVERAKEAVAHANAVSTALEAARSDATRLNTQLAEEHERKDEFLAMLAHELRNPLSGVLAASQLLKLKGSAGPIGERAMAIIERQANQLRSLIDDLTDVSRVNQGRIELKLQRVDLWQTLHDAIEANRHALEAKQIELTISTPTCPQFVRGDAARLTQVFSNLLHNASKYTETGGHVAIAQYREGNTAVVRVADDGIGIAEDMLSLVFEMFKQAPVAIARSQGGLGMGLTLVRKLLTMHHGNIEAASDGIGRGSTFTARLPLDLTMETDIAAASAGSSSEQRKLQVLLVDDNLDAAEAVAALLVATGHQVEVAHSGRRALEMLDDEPWDLLVLDLGLPDVDGFTLARAARHSRGSALRIVALTGYDGNEIRKATAEAGFDAHFVKPFSQASLNDIVGAAGSS